MPNNTSDDLLTSNLERIAVALEQIAQSLKTIKPIVSALSEIADAIGPAPGKSADSIIDQLKIH